MKKSIISAAVAVFILGGFMMALIAQETPLLTDRPDFTESPRTVSVNSWQFEFGVTFSKIDLADNYSAGELLIRKGLLRNVELRLGMNSFQWQRVSGQMLSGFEDISLGLKINILNSKNQRESKVPEIALIVETSLPTGSVNFRNNTLQPTAIFAISYDFLPGITLGSNLIYARLDEGRNRFNQLSGSLSLGFSLSKTVGSYFEYYGFSPSQKGKGNSHYLNFGFTRLFNRNFQIDFRLGKGLNGVKNDFFAGTGMAIRIE